MTEWSNEEHSDSMEKNLCEADGLLARPKMFCGFMELELTLSEETATGSQPGPDESFRAPLGYILIFSSHLLLDLAVVPLFFLLELRMCSHLPYILHILLILFFILLP
jgi:hypothetical protein